MNSGHEPDNTSMRVTNGSWADLTPNEILNAYAELINTQSNINQISTKLFKPSN